MFLKTADLNHLFSVYPNVAHPISKNQTSDNFGMNLLNYFPSSQCCMADVEDDGGLSIPALRRIPSLSLVQSSQAGVALPPTQFQEVRAC